MKLVVYIEPFQMQCLRVCLYMGEELKGILFDGLKMIDDFLLQWGGIDDFWYM